MTCVIDLIRHYQRNIEKCAVDEKRVLRCLDKLHQLGVTVHHLQETGVGRTVNALRKEPGEVGTAARALVAKWKHMVASAEDSSEAEDEPPDNKHSGRDSPDDSDHQNDSREEGISCDSDQEAGRRNYTKHNNQKTGSRDESTKRHLNSDDDGNRKKRSKYNEDSSDEEVKPAIRELKRKNEHSDSYDYDDDDDDDNEKMEHAYASDSTNNKNRHIKVEQKSNNDRENSRSKPSKHSSRERIDNNRYQDDALKSHNSHSSNSESRRKSEINTKKENDNLKHKLKESTKGKDVRHCSEKHSPFDKRTTGSRDSSLEKHISASGKHKKSDKGKINADRHKSSETSISKEKKNSSEKHSISSEKHKSSSHKSKEESTSHRKDKYCESERTSHHEDKSRNHESSSYHKEKSRNRENSTSLKDKHKKHANEHENLEKREKERPKEQSRGRDTDSKSKYSDHSSSNSHKDKKEKSFISDSKHKSCNDLITVNKENKSSEKSNSTTRTKDRASSSQSSSKSKNDAAKKRVKTQIDVGDGDGGIDCQSGASFAEALGMTSPVKTKKKSQPKEVGSVLPPASTSNGEFPMPTNLLAPSTKLAPLPPLEISALPEISPNYKPRPPPKLLSQVNDEDALNFVMSTKNQRTKVFSGNKTYGKVLTLYELCVNVLQEHIDALEYTGGVPYEILKPVIDRATPEQLFVLEHYNPYLMEDTNHLWQRHCERKFRNKQREEMETSREMYMRCQEEQEARLKSLTANIKMSQDARNAPTKQTKMAYVDTVVKPPRNIARKQAIHGTARAAVTSPAARVAALAGANVMRAGSVPGRPSLSSFAPIPSSSSSLKPKKAPLMQKALQFMRGRKR